MHAIGDVGPLHNTCDREPFQGKQRTTIDIHRHMPEEKANAVLPGLVALLSFVCF